MISKKITGEYSLRSDLVDLLISKGYPEDSFFVDFEIEGTSYSLVIKDPVSQSILAIYEYDITSPVVVTSAGIRKALEKYLSLSINPKVHLYIVHGVQGGTSYTISKILYQTKNSHAPLHTGVKEVINFKELKQRILINNDKKHMDEKPNDPISKLRQKIEQIEKLKTSTPWGAEYKLWGDSIKSLIKQIFGSKGLDLFERQQTVVISDEGYRNELDERKLLLQGMLDNKEDYKTAEILKDFKPDNISEIDKAEKGINWTKWGTIATIIFGIIGFLYNSYPQEKSITQKTDALFNSINTNGQTGGTNTVNNTVIINQTASELVHATQADNNVRIDLSQLKHKYVEILYVARNGQVLISPESWINNNGIITLYNASKDEQFIVQYTY